MAALLNRGNRADIERAITQLDPTPASHVLELGFGGGHSLDLLLARQVRVTGVEPAVAMRARAFRKHAWALAEEHLTIVDARAEALPDGPFDAAVSMNTAYFWDDVPAAMSELARTVQGTVLLGIAPVAHLEDMGFRESGFRVEPPEFYAEALQVAGFRAAIEPGAVCSLVLGYSSM